MFWAPFPYFLFNISCFSFNKPFSLHLPRYEERSGWPGPLSQRRTSISLVILPLSLSILKSPGHIHMHSYTKTNAGTHSRREWIWKRALRTLRLAPAASYLIVLHVTMETGAAAAWQTSSASVFYSICACVYVRRVRWGVFCEEGIVTCASNILLDWKTGLCLLTSVTWLGSWQKPRPPMRHNQRFSLVQHKQIDSSPVVGYRLQEKERLAGYTENKRPSIINYTV